MMQEMLDMPTANDPVTVITSAQPDELGDKTLSAGCLAVENKKYSGEPSDSVACPPDPFDPASLRLSQDFANSIGVKKVLTVVPCRKPNRHEFVRVRPGEEWRLATGVFEDKINREVYLVSRDLWSELGDEVQPVCLFLATNRQGDVFLWPGKLPKSDGRSNTWNESALAAASLAEAKWVRLVANMSGGMYDTFAAAGELSEPIWPELLLTDILRLCFKDRFIQSVDHPAIRALRGLV
jgi:hypothetical protein